MASKFVCINCGIPCGLWARGKGVYWKHQNGGYPAKKTCGKPAVAVRRAELDFSPAMRAALAEVRGRMLRGTELEEAIRATCNLRGFMRNEVRKAYALVEAAE
jgi:hypothetical protein